MANTDEGTLLATLSKELLPSGKALHKRLVSAGCVPYVKTIYIGYDLGGVMVAALYPHVDRIEIALALPEDYESALLIDATHLTWKTLPVAAVLKTADDLDESVELVDEACRRIHGGHHDIERPNDYFMKSRRETDLGSHRPKN